MRRTSRFNALGAAFCVVAASFLLINLSGCGESGPRRSITGKVTFAGAPLEQGSIQFLRPDKPAAGPLAGAVISKGQYSLPSEQGLEPGKYQVKITSPEINTQGLTPDQMMRGAVAKSKERLPPKYNVQTTLTAEITPSGSNQIDFTLE